MKFDKKIKLLQALRDVKNLSGVKLPSKRGADIMEISEKIRALRAEI